MEKKDHEDLVFAFKLLNQKTITEKLTSFVGQPIDYLLSKIPPEEVKEVHELVKLALNKAADLAFLSLDNDPGREASTILNKFFGALSGAVGGALGMMALPVELPISVTLMLRSIADIARSEGFDLEDESTKFSCVEVFALGGPSDKDDAVDTAYYATRSFTSEVVQVLSKELAEIAAKQTSTDAVRGITATQGGIWLAVLIEKIAARFGVVITEKIAAQIVPAVGAFTGGALNTMFTDYYQDMARGHFIVKRLENKYSFDAVKIEYDKIKIAMLN